jgi:branched-chain amino acid transport system substrate-binding protein
MAVSTERRVPVRKSFLLVLTMLLVVAAASLHSASATTGGGATASTTGITNTTIKLGATCPLSGIAAAYASICRGMQAYYSYVNARKGPDGKRGVGGRQIIWKFYDDAYNPAQAVQLTQKLVLEDKVFAIVGSVGTEVNLAIRPFLNQRKVPHTLISTGASYWGLEYKKWKWTIGWQPDYISEGRVYGKWIAKNAPNAKIAIFYQNDDYGKDYLKGVESGLGAKKSLIVSKENYEVTDSSYASQIAKQKISGANTWVLLTTPTPTVRAIGTAKALAWKPDSIVINSVAASDAVMLGAERTAGAAYVDGDISTAYLKYPTNPKYANDAAVKRYMRLMGKYAPSANPKDLYYYYGFAKAYDSVRLLYLAGKNPTRESYMRATARMNWVNPFDIKGVLTKTTATDRFPLDQVKIIRYASSTHTWSETGGLIKGR